MKTKPALPLGKVISGGEAGVGQAALDWAMARGIPSGTGATVEEGVHSGHGSLILVTGEPEGDAVATIEYALEMMKPIYIVRLDAGDLEAEAGKVLDWLRTHSIRILNVAGPREGSCPGIGVAARGFLDRLI